MEDRITKENKIMEMKTKENKIMEMMTKEKKILEMKVVKTTEEEKQYQETR
jgi:hypothetical protein